MRVTKIYVYECHDCGNTFVKGFPSGFGGPICQHCGTQTNNIISTGLIPKEYEVDE